MTDAHVELGAFRRSLGFSFCPDIAAYPSCHFYDSFAFNAMIFVVSSELAFTEAVGVKLSIIATKRGRSTRALDNRSLPRHAAVSQFGTIRSANGKRLEPADKRQ